MRISLLASNGSTYALAGQSGVSERVHSSAANMRIDPQAVMDILRAMGDRWSSPNDLGGQTNRVSFSTTRTFSTAAEALLFCTDYDALTPRSGILVIEALSGDTVIGTRHMQSAVMDPPSRSINGCTATLTYSISGGEIKPGSAITLFAGIPWNWILQPWGSVTSNWETY